MVNNPNSEFELYEPIRQWLQRYLQDKFQNCDIITLDSHSRQLDRVLRSHKLSCPVAVGLDIKIDVLGIVRNIDRNSYRLFFVEAKKNPLTIRDLGQLWAYCKLINPHEAFLFTSSTLGSLDKILNVFKRDDLLDFGEGKVVKKIKVATWNIGAGLPNYDSMIPKG